jgi:iron complex outermembrane receptor protein
MLMESFASSALWRRSLAVLALTILSPTVLAAQAATISGIVSRADGGAPVRGASVSVVSTNLQTLTADDGTFTLRGVPQGPHTLVATFLGEEAARLEVDVPASGRVEVSLSLERVSAVEGVVVTASRNVQVLKDVPATVSVVTPMEIDRRAPTVNGEELAGVAGVTVRDNSEGTFTTVRIRGVPNSHQNNVVLAMVDGVPFVTGGDEVDFERLVPAPLIERVEVVKGPTSALYGRGGVAGAVNYITRPAFGQTGIHTSLQAGSYGHLRPAVTASIPLDPGRHQLLVSGFWETKDGFVRGAGRESVNLFLKDEWLLGDRTQLTLYGNFWENEQATASHMPFTEDLDPLVPLDPRTNFQIPGAGADRRVWFGSARLAHRFSPAVSLSTVVHWRDHESLDVLGFSDSFNTDQNAFFWNGFSADESDETFFLEPQLEWDAGRVRLTAGASLERKNGTEVNVWTGENGFPTPDFEFLFYVQKVSAETGELLNADRLQADTLSDYAYDGSIDAGYAQLEVDVTDRVSLTLGVRYDHFSRELRVRRPVDGTPAETLDDTEGHLSPKASVAARLTDDVTAFATFGEGFNPAFGPPFVFSGRPSDLKPEVARNYEAGLKGSVLDGDLAFALAAFRLERHDLLLTLFGSEAGQTQTVNAGEHRSSGFEAELFGRLGPGLQATAAYGYVDSRWIDNRFANAFSGELIDWSGNDVAGVPAHTLTLGLSGEWGPATLSGWYDWESDGWIDNGNSIRGGGFGLLHGAVGLSPASLGGAELRLTAKNLLDEEYHFFFPGAFGGVEGFRGRPFELLAEVRYAW